MKYDFDKVVNRKNTDSLKWNVKKGELPMWVADMDFATAPEITEAILERTHHGVFGYTEVSDAWKEAYQSWWSRRYGFLIEKEWLLFTTGVVPAISSIVRKLTTPGENVLFLTPVYNIFYNSVLNNGRRVLECPLIYKEGLYEIDEVSLTENLADPQTTLLLWCNPHNPVGKIWDKDTMQRIGELCKKYHVTVVSDEIHCDLTRPGENYTPFASVSATCKEVSISLVAPTKSFNLAGIQTAACIVPSANLRHKVWRGINTDEVAEPNVFACPAVVAAYTNGEKWLEELREYIFENRCFVEDYVSRNIKDLTVVHADATYLVWVDIGAVFADGIEARDYIRKETGLYICDGNEYGKSGEKFVRINIACARSVVEDGMHRLKEAVEKKKNA